MNKIDTEGATPLLLAFSSREASTDTVSSLANDKKREEESPLWTQDNSEDLIRKHEGIGNSLAKALPNMWSKEYIGLYSQYAAVGK
jgi:hypothetical protein